MNESSANVFIEYFKFVSGEVHRIAVEHGWWDKPRNDGEAIALMHSELSEALEAQRHGDPPDDKIPDFTGQEAELADVIIRIMDYAHARKLNVGQAVIAKIKYNETREYKHGGKMF